MRNVYNAPKEASRDVPAYKIQRINKQYTTEQYFYDEKTKTLGKRDIQHEEGYMIHFPRGHSIFKKSLEEIEAMGYGRIVPLIRMDQESEMNDLDKKEKSVEIDPDDEDNDASDFDADDDDEEDKE